MKVNMFVCFAQFQGAVDLFSNSERMNFLKETQWISILVFLSSYSIRNWGKTRLASRRSVFCLPVHVSLLVLSDGSGRQNGDVLQDLQTTETATADTSAEGRPPHVILLSSLRPPGLDSTCLELTRTYFSVNRRGIQRNTTVSPVKMPHRRLAREGELRGSVEPRGHPDISGRHLGSGRLVHGAAKKSPGNLPSLDGLDHRHVDVVLHW